VEEGLYVVDGNFPAVTLTDDVPSVVVDTTAGASVVFDVTVIPLVLAALTRVEELGADVLPPGAGLPLTTPL
jgi:hypothetical protein